MNKKKYTVIKRIDFFEIEAPLSKLIDEFTEITKQYPTASLEVEWEKHEGPQCINIVVYKE